MIKKYLKITSHAHFNLKLAKRSGDESGSLDPWPIEELWGIAENSGKSDSIFIMPIESGVQSTVVEGAIKIWVQNAMNSRRIQFLVSEKIRQIETVGVLAEFISLALQDEVNKTNAVNLLQDPRVLITVVYLNEDKVLQNYSCGLWLFDSHLGAQNPVLIAEARHFRVNFKQRSEFCKKHFDDHSFCAKYSGSESLGQCLNTPRAEDIMGNAAVDSLQPGVQSLTPRPMDMIDTLLFSP